MARILVLTSSYPASAEDGVCGYVHDLARRLATDWGHAVTVLAPHDPEARDDARFAPVRVERFRHLGARRISASADIGAALAGSRAARLEAALFSASFRRRAARLARGADAVLSHWLVPAGAIGASLGRPHIPIAHGGDVHLLGRLPGGAAIARTIAARSHRVVCVSEGLARRVAALAPDAKTEVVAMGAELGPAPDPEEVAELRERLGAGDATVALFLGRLVPIKGVDVLLDAARRAPNVALWIAGDGPEEGRLRERATAARLHASFLGRVDRRRRRLLLAACDAVVVPSRIEAGGREEGAPVVCSESLAAGRPVIATRMGGIVDVIDDEETGLLVAPGDPVALGDALVRLGGDPALRARLAASAAVRGETRTMRATAARVSALVAESLTR